MTLTVVVEDGSGLANANSYASEADGDDYAAARLYSTDWTGAVSGNKQIALVQATRLLDQLADWKGDPSTTTQALRWPRYGVPDRDNFQIIDSATIPQWLKDATCELAIQLLASDRAADPDTAGFRSIRAGSVALEIDKYDRPAILP